MRRMVGLVLPLLAAGGCGIVPDDPTNIPLAGRWHKSLRMVALTINDFSVERANAPFAIPPDRETTFCGEPFMRNREEAQREIDKIEGVRCTIDETQVDDATVTGGGTCEMKPVGTAKLGAKLAFTAEQARDAMDLRQDFDAYVHLPDGQTEQVRLVHKVEYHRVGDCV